MPHILAVPKEEFHKRCDQQWQQPSLKKSGASRGDYFEAGGCSFRCSGFGTFATTVLWLHSQALSSEKSEPSHLQIVSYTEH